MDALLRSKRLNLALAPAVAGVVGTAIALAMLLVPGGLLEEIVSSSGLPAVMAAAEPPLGFTARVGLALLLGGGTAVVAWFSLYLMVGERSVMLGTPVVAGQPGVPVLRRADAHPDAPPRRPLLASEDLFPLTSRDVAAASTPAFAMPDPEPAEEAKAAVTVGVAEAAMPPLEQPLPADLDQPLAAFDRAAVPAQPAEAPRALPPLAWQPTPAAPLAPVRSRADTIDDLLQRFENAMTRQPPRPVPAPAAKRQGLRESLESLRRMATE